MEEKMLTDQELAARFQRIFGVYPSNLFRLTAVTMISSKHFSLRDYLLSLSDQDYINQVMLLLTLPLKNYSYIPSLLQAIGKRNDPTIMQWIVDNVSDIQILCDVLVSSIGETGTVNNNLYNKVSSLPSKEAIYRSIDNGVPSYKAKEGIKGIVLLLSIVGILKQSVGRLLSSIAFKGIILKHNYYKSDYIAAEEDISISMVSYLVECLREKGISISKIRAAARRDTIANDDIVEIALVR